MKVNFNRRSIEESCIFLAFVSVLFFVFFIVIAIADKLFSWDLLLSDSIEKIAILIISAVGVIIVAAFFISFMVNFSLISLSLEKIADKVELKRKNHE